MVARTDESITIFDKKRRKTCFRRCKITSLKSRVFWCQVLGLCLRFSYHAV